MILLINIIFKSYAILGCRARDFVEVSASSLLEVPVQDVSTGVSAFGMSISSLRIVSPQGDAGGFQMQAHRFGMHFDSGFLSHVIGQPFNRPE
jgi:hypothetical protein